MPKNQQGQVVCINQGTSFNNGTSIHQMTKVPGTALLSKSTTAPNGQPMIDGSQGLTLDVYICQICKYTELYVNPEG